MDGCWPPSRRRCRPDCCVFTENKVAKLIPKSANSGLKQRQSSYSPERRLSDMVVLHRPVVEQQCINCHTCTSNPLKDLDTFHPSRIHVLHLCSSSILLLESKLSSWRYLRKIRRPLDSGFVGVVLDRESVFDRWLCRQQPAPEAHGRLCHGGRREKRSSQSSKD